MPERFQIQRRVEFCETDAAGIVHFSAFFLYMEQAEHALLRALGTSVVSPQEDGVISWPRVNATCDFAAVAHFEQVLDVSVSICRLGKSSVTYQFDFTLAGKPIAQGKMTSVCCRIVPGQPPRPVPIPRTLAEQLRKYVAADSDA
jgi:acyl-CoA thioester hydrolase